MPKLPAVAILPNGTATTSAMRWAKRLMLFLLVLFLAPVVASGTLWALADRPANWRAADWGSSGLLPAPASDPDAVIHILAARTGGMKGALSVHSWIVTKRAGQSSYDRYEKVGWGLPIRKNGNPADGRWYSNDPFIVASLRGPKAALAIAKVEEAIAGYPHRVRGAYRIWPGPNSNSFVAHVLRRVPELGTVLPPNAIGRDYPADGRLFSADPDWRDFHFSLFGLAGLSIGLRSGFEVNLLGLAAGIDILRPAIKLPAVGRFGFGGASPEAARPRLSPWPRRSS